MIEKYDKFLIFVAHPDDEVLGCGGVLKKLSKLNKKIRVVVLAEGSSCRYKNYIKSKKEIVRSIKERKNSCKKALKDLGVNDFIFYDLQCGKLSSMPITSVAKIIEKEIMESGKGSSGQTELSRNDLSNMKISFPKDKSEQKEIVKKIEDERKVIEGNKKLIETYTQKIQDRINKVWGED